MDPLTALETSTRIAAGDVGILDIVDAALEAAHADDVTLGPGSMTPGLGTPPENSSVNSMPDKPVPARCSVFPARSRTSTP